MKKTVPNPHRYQKGNPGGPGRPKKHPDDVGLKMLHRTDVKVIMNRLAQMDIDKLEEVLKDKSRTVLEHIIGRVCLVAMKEGDYRRLDALLDRLIGKVKEEVEIKMPKPVLVENLEGSAKLLTTEQTIDAEIIDGNNPEIQST